MIFCTNNILYLVNNNEDNVIYENYDVMILQYNDHIDNNCLSHILLL